MIRPIIAIVLAGILAGCGGKGGGGETTTTTAKVTTPNTAAPRALYKFPPTMRQTPSSVDVGNAKSISLTRNDFPATWKFGEPLATTQPRAEVEDEVFVNCLFGENPSALSGYAVSDVYVDPDFTTQYRSFVRVVTSKNNNAADFQNFTAARIASCQDGMYDYEQLPPKEVDQVQGKKFGNALPIEMPVDNLTLTDAETAKSVLGFRMIITPTDASSTHQDIFAYGAGRYEVVMIVQARVVPDTTQETTVFAKMKSRAFSAAKLG